MLMKHLRGLKQLFLLMPIFRPGAFKMSVAAVAATAAAVREGGDGGFAGEWLGYGQVEVRVWLQTVME